MQKIFLAVIDMSIVSSLVILAVLLVRALLKRAPRRFAYVLWAAVLLRLLCPFAVESPLSLIPERAGEIAQSAALPEAEDVTFVSAASAAYRAIGDTANGGQDFVRVEVAAPAVVQGNERESERQYVSASHGQVWLLLCAWLWPAGTAAVLVWGIAGQIRLRRMLVGAVKLEGEVWLADHIPTAFVMGLVRPKIYLPSGLDGAGRDYVLAHERAHIRRGDHITRLLAFAALALHWFNPLVWLAFAMSGRDMEMSCDEAVMRRSGGDIRADYCQTLLDMSANKHFPSPCLLAFGEGDTGARVRNALRWKKPAFWAVCGAGVLIIVACVLLLTNQAAKKSGTVEISFPAYQDGRSVGTGEQMFYDVAYDRTPFTMSVALPKGWTAESPEELRARTAGDSGDLTADGCTLYTPVQLYDEKGKHAGFVGWSDYAPYEGDDMPEGDYYKSVYYSLRLGAHYGWEDFEELKGDEYTGTHTATVYYQTPVEGMSAAAWPQHSAPGVCHYDRRLNVYVAMQLDAGAATEKEILEIADSISLSASGPDAAAGSQTVKVSFPGHYVDVNRAGKIWNPGPFVASMKLPEGWTVRSGWSETPDGYNGEGYSRVYFRRDADDVYVGKISYCAFDPADFVTLVGIEGWTDADYTRARFCTELYTQRHWQDFESVAYSDTAETFRASVLHTVYTDKTEIDTRYCIGRYDTELGVYVAIELREGSVSESEAAMIAESLALEPVGISSDSTYFGFGGYDYSGGIRRGRGPFTVNMHLPEGWSSWFTLDGGEAPDAEHLPDTHALLNPGYIYDENGRCVAFAAWAGFDPNAYPDDATDRGLSTAVNAALKERTDWAKYGWEQLDFSKDSGIVYVSQIIDGDDVDTGRRAILVYNREMEAIVVVEFANGREYDWAARLIAGNIRQLDKPGLYSGGRGQELIVPGYYRNEDGALAECRAFRAELTLPEGWSLGGTETRDDVDTFGLRPLAYMYDRAGDYAGFVGWQELGRGVETQGIRVESEEVGAFVCVRLETGAASEEELDKIARSVELKPGRVQYVPRFAGVDWGTDRGTMTEDSDGVISLGRIRSTSWSFLGHDCKAYYQFGPDGLLDSGRYSFNDAGTLTQEEKIELYKQLLAELEDMYGESHTPASLDYRTPMDIQSVIDGKSDMATNSWTKQSPGGDGVDIYLELHGNDLTVSYSLLYE